MQKNIAILASALLTGTAVGSVIILNLVASQASADEVPPVVAPQAQVITVDPNIAEMHQNENVYQLQRSELETTLVNRDEAFNQQLVEAHAQITTAEEHLTALQQARAEAEARVIELETSISTADEQYQRELATLLEQAKADEGTLQAEIVRLTADIQTAYNQIAAPATIPGAQNQMADGSGYEGYEEHEDYDDGEEYEEGRRARGLRRRRRIRRGRRARRG